MGGIRHALMCRFDERDRTMSDQPTDLEKSVESTRKLAWMDDMLRHYVDAQYHLAHILENMRLQVRMDDKAYGVFTTACNLITTKIDRMAEARAELYEQHSKLMARLLEGGE